MTPSIPTNPKPDAVPSNAVQLRLLSVLSDIIARPNSKPVTEKPSASSDKSPTSSRVPLTPTKASKSLPPTVSISTTTFSLSAKVTIFEDFSNPKLPSIETKSATLRVISPAALIVSPRLPSISKVTLLSGPDNTSNCSTE